MIPPTDAGDGAFRDALLGLRRGDFSRLEPLFIGSAGDTASRPHIVQWHEQGRFADHPTELAEARTCACFNGRISVVEYLLSHGVSATAGNGTGLDALHWAANRGQLDAVRLLLAHGAPLETRSMYDGTVLRTAVWSAINEPRPAHNAIVEALLAAGANVAEEVNFPTGHAALDDLLRRYGAA